jgi:hypothetical protein
MEKHIPWLSLGQGTGHSIHFQVVGDNPKVQKINQYAKQSHIVLSLWDPLGVYVYLISMRIMLSSCRELKINGIIPYTFYFTLSHFITYFDRIIEPQNKDCL